ncbi:MAG: 50S ribosomal protein L29 [Candidatus Wildermuthbacteria bacterium]|nr:50S ribosomal protein L29 [Candidatus Wildermuthbacteria bacterium]
MDKTKTTKPAEVKSMSEAELQKELAEKRNKLRDLRFDLASGKVKNVREIREIKHRIAQILTSLQQIKSNQ